MNEFGSGGKAKPTLNCTGWSAAEPHEINLLFAEYAAKCAGPVLDLGAGFGVATLAALDAGATVIANDVDSNSLLELQARVAVGMRGRFRPCPGRFPNELEFSTASLAAIHASNVLHFLDPAEFEAALALLFRWLRPDGKIFLMVNSVYLNNVKNYIPEFTRRKAAGQRWPGWVDDLTEYSCHPTLQYLPKRLHLFDAEVLGRAVTLAGFNVESVKEFTRSGLPDSLRYDGRENVILVARK